MAGPAGPLTSPSSSTARQSAHARSGSDRNAEAARRAREERTSSTSAGAPGSPDRRSRSHEDAEASTGTWVLEPPAMGSEIPPVGDGVVVAEEFAGVR